MRIAKIVPYVIYIIAFSFVCSLASVLHTALTVWSWDYSVGSFTSVSDIIRQFPEYIFYAVLQVIAALLTVRQLSLRKLFYLSCIFCFISALLVGLHHQMVKVFSGLSFPFLLIGQVLPYVAPVIILALIRRKKTDSEPVPDIEEGTRWVSTKPEVASDNVTTGKIKALYMRYWCVFDIFLIIVVFCYGTLHDPFGFMMYVCGLYNQLAIMAVMTFIWVIWLVPVALCYGVLLLRSIISWPRHIKKKSVLLLLRLLVIFGLGAYLVLPFTPVRPHGFNVYIKGFEKYIRAKADIAGIRSWLDTLEPDDCVVYNITNAHDGTKSSSPKDLQEQEWPEVISTLKPRYVTLSVDEDKHPKVRLNWGSGFLGSWGLVVGNEAMPTPESDLSQYGEYRREIHKGTYIWYGIE